MIEKGLSWPMIRRSLGTKLLRLLLETLGLWIRSLARRLRGFLLLNRGLLRRLFRRNFEGRFSSDSSSTLRLGFLIKVRSFKALLFQAVWRETGSYNTLFKIKHFEFN
jgi:hypothetical protein